MTTPQKNSYPKKDTLLKDRATQPDRSSLENVKTSTPLSQNTQGTLKTNTSLFHKQHGLPLMGSG